MTPERFARARAALDRLAILLFAALLVAPALDPILRPDADRGPKREERVAAPRPGAPRTLAELNPWPARYEAWFNDSFGLRDVFLFANNWLRVVLLRTPPTRKYVVGDEGWIYYAGNGALEDFRGLQPFDETELARWKTRLEARRDWLAARGVRFLFVVEPNKESIYPEHYPYRRFGPSHLEQLADYLARHSDVEFLDLRAPLLAAKHSSPDKKPIYSPDGSHWSGYGGFVAAREIAARLERWFPAIRPLDIAECEPRADRDLADTLTRAFYLDSLYGTPVPIWVRRESAWHDFGISDLRRSMGRSAGTSQSAPDLPRAIVFHDSFMLYTQQSLAEYFSRLSLEWRYDFDFAAVEAERPDVVVQMVVERMLGEGAQFDFAPPSSLAPRTGTIVSTFDAARDDREVQALEGAEIMPIASERDSFLRVTTRSHSSGIALPARTLGDGLSLRAWLDVDAQSASTVELQFECLGGGRASQTVALARGRNFVAFDFERSDVQGTPSLRFEDPGVYLVRRFEVRRAAN